MRGKRGVVREWVAGGWMLGTVSPIRIFSLDGSEQRAFVGVGVGMGAWVCLVFAYAAEGGFLQGACSSLAGCVCCDLLLTWVLKGRRACRMKIFKKGG